MNLKCVRIYSSLIIMWSERKAIKLEIGNRITGFFFLSCLALINFQSEEHKRRKIKVNQGNCIIVHGDLVFSLPFAVIIYLFIFIWITCNARYSYTGWMHMLVKWEHFHQKTKNACLHFFLKTISYAIITMDVYEISYFLK